ncbi:MAG: thioredoxin-dependent thiol peroxidase [Candidatus Aenigmatarchaeota archaeon]|nr:MAG: thioredoxin-dependent thiol peroxidase [Candidatus Aenigmarchaeota archaeon]
MVPERGTEAPDFCLRDSENKEVCLRDMNGKNIVLYFYPKDNTPACTIEARDFSKLREEFEKFNTSVIGVSRDSAETHQKFIDRKGLSIKLLSDPAAVVQKRFGVWRPKKFMGREFNGTVRSTFLIDSVGRIAEHWDGVKVKNHAEHVLEAVKALPT